MREFSVPPLVEPRTSGGLADLAVDWADREPGRVLFGRPADGGWADVTAATFADDVVAVARGLVANGVEPGDRVGLMSRNRYEWTVFDFGCWAAGAIPVPVYPTSSAEQAEWMLSDSGAVACMVETRANQEMLDGLRGNLPGLRHVWCFDSGGLDALVDAGADVENAEIDRRRAAVTQDSTATIIYTSGTTGRPKGCVLTHGNFFREVDNAVALLADLFLMPNARTLMFLPLAHVFGRMVEVAVVLAGGIQAYTADVTALSRDLTTFRPTFFLCVPYVFERVYNRARQKAKDDGKQRIFDAAIRTAVAYSRALESGGPGLGVRVRHAVFDRLVYRKLRDRFGGDLRYVVSGGAPLGDRLGHFFRGIGVTVFEGYGLTETTAAAAANSPDHFRMGTVGRPLPGVTARIADDGELLLRGGPVAERYWNNEAATAEAYSDGWFATGDLASLDDDGFVTITGRKKELLVTAGGKNVAPNVLEDRIRAHPLVSQCIVVGDRRPYVAALVTIDAEAFGPWKAEAGKPADATVADLADDADLRSAVQEAVDQGNAAVSRAESVRRFHILDDDFTVDNGYLTPSLKLRRNVISDAFADRIDALYERTSPS